MEDSFVMDDFMKAINIREGLPEDFPESAVRVIKDRYLVKDEQDLPVETVFQLFHRVSESISGIEEDEKLRGKLYSELMRMQLQCKWRFNSPTYMNVGRKLSKGKKVMSPAACYVSNLQDSIDSIFETIREAALIHKEAGGYGYALDQIRPANEYVSSSNGRATGPFRLLMRQVQIESEDIDEGGFRRAANMAACDVDYPMIDDFIKCKADGKSFSALNISVKLPNWFMDDLINNGGKKNFPLLFKGNPLNSFGKPYGVRNVKKVFDEIVNYAWLNGEPGVLFIDKMNEANPTPKLGKFLSTNPCGEQPLLPHEACNLGSFNLAAYISKDGKFEYGGLSQDLRYVVRAMDNVISWSILKKAYPFKKISDAVERTRKLGIGVMGFADLLYKLRVPYDSDRAVEFARNLMSDFQADCHRYSEELGAEKGDFKAFKDSVWASKKKHMRNAALTVIAPSGTTSLTAGCSNSIEPLFALVYFRNIMGQKNIPELHQGFLSELKGLGLNVEDIIERIGNVGSIKSIEDIPIEIRNVYRTSHDIDPTWHVKIQEAFQAGVDAAVSKTINLPSKATREDVAEAIILAYKGCKGVTLYRDGSRAAQPQALGRISDTIKPRVRPSTTWGISHKVKTGCGTVYISANRDEKGLCEVFAASSSRRGCLANIDVVTLVLSRAVRAGVDIEALFRDFAQIECPACVKAMEDPESGVGVRSAIHAILLAYREYLKYEQSGAMDKFQPNTLNCKKCGASFYSTSRCAPCPSCGDSGSCIS